MNNKITFSQTVKNEIAREEDFSEVRRKALLSAYLRINGVLTFKNRETQVKLRSENSKVARYIYANLKKYYPKNQVHLQFEKKPEKKTTYYIKLDDNADAILEDLGVDYFEGKISKEIAYNDETIAGYIAGAFLASGSVNSPKTTNYHLEITVSSENYAKWLSKLFYKYKKIELNPRIIQRREKSVLYFKKSDQISNFLIMVGAPETCMEFEGERVKRDYINSENRLTNFDEANMRRASQIGKRQAKEIKYIDDVLGIHNLHNPKKELLCYLRMENKELSLVELAELMSEELGQIITKSNVNHLFRSLHGLYIKLIEVKK
ncbi:MAG: DNA-binding protein WhiA [Bacilli bacterium]|nr:DNA-binding protein WhiA [Bacilli bacterium]